MEHHGWFIERTSEGWSDALPLPLKLDRTLAGMSLAESGRLYVGGVFVFEPEGGSYSSPTDLSGQLDGDYPFVAADESYLLLCVGARRNLAVSYREPDNSWSPLEYITENDSTYWIQGFPIISPDGQYLFFTADHDIYWMSAEFLREPSKSR